MTGVICIAVIQICLPQVPELAGVDGANVKNLFLKASSSHPRAIHLNMSVEARDMSITKCAG